MKIVECGWSHVLTKVHFDNGISLVRMTRGRIVIRVDFLVLMKEVE